MGTVSDFDKRIAEFGRQIFAELEDSPPSLLDHRYLSTLLMRWSMALPEFKTNLFRLVDVLPTLSSDQEIADHVREYLIPPATRIHPSLGWLIGLTNTPVLEWITGRMVLLGVKQMASTFIAGSSAPSALGVLRGLRREGYSFTADLLGEFCVCEREAREYLDRYLSAIDTFCSVIPSWEESAPLIEGHPGERCPVNISVKLSALYSQTSPLNFDRSVGILSERLSEIARRVRQQGAQLYVDAEDSGNNSIIYECFRKVFSTPEFIDFPFPGIVVQAYAKSSEARVRELLDFAGQRGTPIAIRLVKGAYWDFEHVVSAQNNWESPLWGHKVSSDAHYEHLSRVLLDNHHLCLPAFGSHNIRSLSHACVYAEDLGLSPRDFEVQLLYGMADPIGRAFTRRSFLVRMYTPLGELLPGMGYLVRRLLENTSNESFLRHTFFDADEVGSLLQAPLMHPEDAPPPPALRASPPPPILTEHLHP